MTKDIKECPTCKTLKESKPTPDGDEICPNCGDREMMDKEKGWLTKKRCCDKCYTTYTTDDYPEHIQMDACLNPNCDCHKECQNECRFQEPYGFVPEAGCEIHDKALPSWEVEFDNNFKMLKYYSGIKKEDKQFTKSLKDFIRQTIKTEREEAVKDCIKIIKKWKNDGENPTEAGLILENILKELKNL